MQGERTSNPRLSSKESPHSEAWWSMNSHEAGGAPVEKNMGEEKDRKRFE